MILTLLAALYGAAQQAFVVYEGAQSTYFVEDHPGSEFSWRVLTGFNPDNEANPGDYGFISASDQHQVTVRWNKAGLYYLEITETDLTGCNNRKILSVNVMADLTSNISITFAGKTSSDCYNTGSNSFNLPMLVLGNNDEALTETDFPISTGFNVNGIRHLQQVKFADQSLNIDEAWFTPDPQHNTIIKVQLTDAYSNDGKVIPIPAGGSLHERTIYNQPEVQFVYADSLVLETNSGHYVAGLISGNPENVSYHWFVDPPGGTYTDLSGINSSSVDISWDGAAGDYLVKLNVEGENGCVSDTVTQTVIVKEKDRPPLFVYAGADTVVGSCQPYRIGQVIPYDTSYTYSWNPARNLSDPLSPTPVFIPGETTTYELTVTSTIGSTGVDSITIFVSDVQANAGNQVVMNKGTTIMLDGSRSNGDIQSYQWTTINGAIEGGSTTANPVVSQPGTYYLDVIDGYGCSSHDSVVVSLFTNAPVAEDDYDTTSYQNSVTIDVLNNDYDPDDDLNPASLSITDNPNNGVVEINNSDNTIIYTPDQSFTGTDVFEYQLCDVTDLCDNAKVYVLVTPLNFLIPQAFTPNGDNINDFFEILGIEYYPNNSITIINRWGKKVYEAKAYGIETNPKFWDGKSNAGGGNGDLPTGTYFYVLDLGNGEKPIAGSVYIDR